MIISKLLFGECRLTTGGNDARFHDLGFRTAASQTCGSEVRPNLLEASLRSGADWKPICFCQRHSLTRFGFGGERWQGDHRRPERRKYREG